MKFENNQKLPSAEELKQMEGYIKKEVIEGKKPEYMEDDPTNISPDEIRTRGVIKREAEKTRKKVQDFTRAYSPVERRRQAQELMKLPKNQRKERLEAFYQRQQKIMEEFKESLDQRNVEDIINKEQVLFTHGIPLDNYIQYGWGKEKAMMNTARNNPVIDTKNVDAETLLKVLLGFQPTISASVAKISDRSPDTHFYKFGLLIGKGRITLAHNRDTATVAENMYSRRVKDDEYNQAGKEATNTMFPRDMATHNIQSNISQNTKQAIEYPIKSMGAKNEIVIEDPETLGVYVDLNGEISKEDLVQIAQIAKDVNLPIFGLQNSKIYRFGEKDRQEVDIQEIQENIPQISDKQKLRYTSDTIKSNAFIDGKIPREAREKIKKLESKTENEDSKEVDTYGDYPDFSYFRNQELMFYNAELMLSGNDRSYPKANNGNELVNHFVQMGVKEPSMAKIREMFAGKTFEECQAFVDRFNQQKKEGDDLIIEWKYPDVEINDQILHVLREKYSSLKLDSGELETIFQKSDFNPEELVRFIKKYFPENYNSDAGVWEKYTIEEHTVMVMNQFEKYFKDKNLPANIDVNFFRLFLSLHDIGKKDAIEQDDKDKQHEHTLAYIELIFDNLGRLEEEKNIALALLSSDPIGKYLKRLSSGYSQEKELFDVVGYITKMAKKAQMPRKDFFELLLLFYKVDASSYTEDSSDKQNLQFFSSIEEKINVIRKEISKEL